MPISLAGILSSVIFAFAGARLMAVCPITGVSVAALCDTVLDRFASRFSVVPHPSAL